MRATTEVQITKAYTVASSAEIRSPAGAAYGIIADYRHGHPHILPPQYFSSLEVEQGGTGEGTILRFRMHAFGKTQDCRASITEPEPGRVLVETVTEPGGVVTTFTVEPTAQGRHCRVTISTALTARRGLAGLLERSMTRAFLRRVYARELRLLANFLSAGSAARRAGKPLHA